MKRFGIESNTVMNVVAAQMNGVLGADYVGLDVFRAHTLATVDQEVDLLALLESTVLRAYGKRTLRRPQEASEARIARKRRPTNRELRRANFAA